MFEVVDELYDVVVVGVYLDDVEVVCGGILVMFQKQGYCVVIVDLIDGEFILGLLGLEVCIVEVQ